MGVVGPPQQSLDAPTEHLYQPISSRCYDARSTLQAMDAKGLDMVVVFRTYAHMVVSIDTLQPEYATAYCATFNDWLADYCRADLGRRRLTAIVSLHDPDGAHAGHGSHALGGVLERFPDLRLSFLEGNCGWLPRWLHRLDDRWQKYGGGEAIKLSVLPSEYFKRQCFIGTDVDEELLRIVMDDIGDDNIVMFVDYPHADGPFPRGLQTFLELPGVSPDSRRKIMWDNGLRLHGFSTEKLLESN
jgi:hypothetical protein